MMKAKPTGGFMRPDQDEQAEPRRAKPPGPSQIGTHPDDVLASLQRIAENRNVTQREVAELSALEKKNLNFGSGDQSIIAMGALESIIAADKSPAVRQMALDLMDMIIENEDIAGVKPGRKPADPAAIQAIRNKANHEMDAPASAASVSAAPQPKVKPTVAQFQAEPKNSIRMPEQPHHPVPHGGHHMPAAKQDIVAGTQLATDLDGPPATESLPAPAPAG